MDFNARKAREALFKRRGIRNAERRQAETMILNGLFTEQDIPFLWEQWNAVLEDIAYAQQLQEVLCNRYGVYYVIPDIDVDDKRIAQLDRSVDVQPLWMLDDDYFQLPRPLCYQRERSVARALWLLGESHNTAQDLYFRVFNVNHYDLQQVPHWYEKFFTVLQHVSHGMTLTVLQQEEIISTFLGRIFGQIFSDEDGYHYSSDTLDWWVNRMQEYPSMLKDNGITETWLTIFSIPDSLQEKLCHLMDGSIPANDAVRLCAGEVHAFWQEHVALMAHSEGDVYLSY